MPKRVRCDLCNILVPQHAHYELRIEVVADPSMPEIDKEDLEEMDFDQTFQKLIAQMEHMTAQEAEDQVYKRMEFKLCPQCQREFIANPLGKPRKKRKGESSN